MGYPMLTKTSRMIVRINYINTSTLYAEEGKNLAICHESSLNYRYMPQFVGVRRKILHHGNDC